jgi:7-cyano-7-deazaguanine synthase in queuosine biosynthesis
MITSMARRALIVCDGAGVSREWRRQEWTDEETITASTRLARRPPDKTIDLVIQGLRSGLLGARSNRTDDLIRIAAYIYRADQLISRGGAADAHDELWQRELALCIPVAEVAFWSRPDVTSLLARALAFATGDVWRFHFSPAPDHLRNQIAYQQHLAGTALSGSPGCIVLFSGGLDSLSVLIEARNRGERPMAVGHWSAPPVNALQQRLIAELTQSPTSLRTIPLVGAWIHGAEREAKERTRRARGFLFACLGGAVAGELGIQRVYFGDNGPISLNLPINDQLTGARVSRSTHPVFLDVINQFMALIYDDAPVFSNPLAMYTRVDCLRSIADAGYAGLIPLTSSCAHWGRLPAATPQCGVCSQCIDRRFATIAAGLSAFDPATRYQIDCFRDHLEDWRAQTLVLSYVRFAQRLVQLSRDDMTTDYPQLFDAVLPEDPDPDATLDGYIDLLQRHAQNVLEVLQSEMRDALPDMAAGQLLPSSLLLLAGFRAIPAQPKISLPEAGAESSLSREVPRLLMPRPSATTLPFTDPDNVFRFDGEAWRLAYVGRTVTVPDERGLLRLAWLLDHPWTEVTGGEILIATVPEMRTAVWNPQAAAAEGLLPIHYGDGGVLGDAAYKRQLQEETQRLLGELEEARDRGQSDRIYALNARIEELAHAVSTTWGLGGRARGFPNTVSKQRETVKRSINRAIKTIAAKHPVLAEHLRASVVRSTVFAYRPDRTISWRIEFPDKAA